MACISSASKRVGKHEGTLFAAHERLFAEWLLSPMSAQHGDLDIWLHRDCGDLERWLGIEPYRALVPTSALEPERALFLCDIEAHLAAFRNQDAPEDRSRSRIWVSEVLDFISQDHTRNLKVLGAELRVTAETLGEAFHARTGLRFRRYSRTIKFLRAVEHLANPQRSIKEAAVLANYSDPSTLIRDCRELLGATPVELQQRLSMLADTAS
jgi:AraC-like DNA-binding protein